MMSFINPFLRIFSYKVLVKNVSPSPQYHGSAIADLETYKGRTATNCSLCGKLLTDEDKVGGHVLKEQTSSPFDYYIVPLCKKCNNSTVTEPYYFNKSELARLLYIKCSKNNNL